ncbi:MAG: SAF domain-containing protein [Streptosporangiaceae bacterium]
MPQQAPATVNGHRPPGGSPPGALSTRTRPKGYAALAVALIVGLGALGYYFYTTAGAKVSVVVASSDISVGQTITRADLSTAEVSGGITAVGANNLSSLEGEAAAVGIRQGTPIQRSMVTSGSTLKAGQSLVGVSADPGQIPSSGLVPGDKVEVLQLPSKGTTGAPSTSGPAAASAVIVASATVYDVRANTTSAGGTLLTLIVPAADSFGVAQASNNSLIALVKIGG